MFRIISILSLIYQAGSQIAPLIYAAPSAVSHQSRIDIKHSPGFISTPFIYSPATTVFAAQPQRLEVVNDAIITPVINTDTVLTPIALSFYHNLPLARALEHPISIEAAQEAVIQSERSDEATKDTATEEQITPDMRLNVQQSAPEQSKVISKNDEVKV